MKKLIALLLALLLAAPALALDENALLKDYIGLTKLLKTNGIDPVKIQWSEIENLCLPLKEPMDQTTYNRCRYEKARDQFTFGGDKAACENEAQAIYPDNYTKPTQAVINANTSSATGNTASTTTITSPAPSSTDLRAMRRNAFDHCMSEKHWRNANNYQLGRTE